MYMQRPMDGSRCRAWLLRLKKVSRLDRLVNGRQSLVLSAVASCGLSVWWDDKHVGIALPPAKPPPPETHGGNCYALIFLHGNQICLCLCLCMCLTRQKEGLTSCCLPFRDTPTLHIPFFFFFHHTTKPSTPYCFHGSFTRPASTLLRRKHITAIYRPLALIRFSAVLLHSLVPFAVFPVIQSSFTHGTASCKLLTSDNGCR
jgi:hypothetical protein